ncbi:MAG: C25 family cysteine peptidase [Planctomycetota bacterium]
MKTIRLSLLMILLLSSAAMAADWVSLNPDSRPGATPEINLLSCNVQETRLEIVLPGFFIEQTPLGALLSVPGWSMTRNVGLPALPAASMLIALPTGDAIDLEVLRSNDFTFSGYQIQLLQTPEVDGLPTPDPVDPLAWKGSYPAMGATQGTSGYMKELPVTSIQAFPFRVDGETGTLTVSSHMLVIVHHDSGRDLWPAVPFSDSLRRRCAASILNFEAVPQSTPRAGGVQYLVITRSYTQEFIQPLVMWKAKCGYKTAVRVLTSVNQNAIKSIIMEYPDVEFVLLVGDHVDVPLSYWSGSPGDYWYACTTGGSNPDFYADLSIGRLSGSTGARITPQVNKILAYEKSPPLSSWLKHTVLVAHREEYPNKYTLCKNEIATAMASSSDWTVTKYYGGQTGKNNAGVSSLINGGVNLLNYRGHGDITEWWSWNLQYQSYYNSDVEALENGSMRPTVLNIACCCADIKEHCMCEAWMDTEGGAVASLGAIDPSYTIPNHDYDKKHYEAFFELDITEIGLATIYATDYIINYHGYLGEDNAKMYLWLGDPSMKLWRTIPGTCDVSHAASIPPGSQDFTVNVSAAGGFAIANAEVCAYKAGEVLEKGFTDSYGDVTLHVSPTTATTMFVTVNHPNYLPVENNVAVTGNGSLLYDQSSISARVGGTVNFALDAGVENAGRNYILLGSISGTQPGTALPGGLATMPLNFDIFTDIVFANLNSTLFTNFLGVLDANGQATAQLNAPAIPAGLAGTIMEYAYAMNYPWDFASNAVGVTVLP